MEPTRNTLVAQRLHALAGVLIYFSNLMARAFVLAAVTA